MEQHDTDAPHTPENPAPGPGRQKAVGLAPHTAYAHVDGYGTIPPRGRVNGVGIVATVLGVIALLLSWIPIINVLSVILGTVAIVCGVVGIRRPLMAKGPSISGLVMGAISVVFASVILVISLAFLGTVQAELGENGLSIEDIYQQLETGEDPNEIINENVERMERELGLNNPSEGNG